MRAALVILGQLADRDIDWLVAHGQRQTKSPGDVIIRENEPCEYLYVILDGRFAVTVQDPARGAEKPVFLATARTGEFFGEMSFVDDEPPSATVTTETESVVLALPRASLRRHLDDHAEFAARFFKALSMLLSDRLQAANEKLSGAGVGSLERDELDLNVLDNVHLAGERFDRILKRMIEG